MFALAGVANKFEVVAFRILFTNAKTFTMLPDVASFTGYAVRPIIYLAVGTTNAVEDPVILLFLEFLECLLVLLDFCLEASFRQATVGSGRLSAILGELGELLLML